MAKIDFRGWRIESDGTGWAVGKPKTRLSKKKELEIYLAAPSFYATLESALAGLLQREVRESDACSAKEIIKLIQEIKADLKEFVTA